MNFYDITKEQVIKRVRKKHPEFSESQFEYLLHKLGLFKGKRKKSEKGGSRSEIFYPQGIVHIICHILKLKKEGNSLPEAFIEIEDILVRDIKKLLNREKNEAIVDYIFANTASEETQRDVVSFLKGFFVSHKDGEIKDDVEEYLNHLGELMRDYIDLRKTVVKRKKEVPLILRDFKTEYEFVELCDKWSRARGDAELQKLVREFYDRMPISRLRN
ncbi:MAG: hypothetical protein ABIH66_00065 [bacterium]